MPPPNVCVGLRSLENVPSPKSHRHSAGSSNDASVNLTVVPSMTSQLKSAVGGGLTTTSWVTLDEPPSFEAVSVTEYVPGRSHWCEVFGFTDPCPSPKSQFHSVGLCREVSWNSTRSPGAVSNVVEAKLATGAVVGFSTVMVTPVRLVPASLVARRVTRYRPGSDQLFTAVSPRAVESSPKSQTSVVGSFNERFVNVTSCPTTTSVADSVN